MTTDVDVLEFSGCNTHVAKADALYVLQWLLQCHDDPRNTIVLPESIKRLSMRAIRDFVLENISPN